MITSIDNHQKEKRYQQIIDALSCSNKRVFRTEETLTVEYLNPTSGSLIGYEDIDIEGLDLPLYAGERDSVDGTPSFFASVVSKLRSRLF